MPKLKCINRKMNTQIMLALLLVSILAVAFNIMPTKAILPVHNINTGLDYATIREAIDAPETQEGHIIKVDAGTYYECFLTISKNGLAILGENPDTTTIDSNATGDVVYITASNIRISGFTIRNGGWAGIYLNYASNNNTVIENTITGNSEYGIYADYSTNNTIRGNTVANNGCGILLWYSSGSHIYHNNFIDNIVQVSNWASNNTWDNGYPSGGNYWSNYTGVDTNSDGIGDTPYFIDANNIDNYPLMKPYAALLGDLDEDRDVDEDDLWYFCAVFITYYKVHWKDPLCDFDNDCDIDEDDLWTFCSAFIDYWKAH